MGNESNEVLCWYDLSFRSGECGNLPSLHEWIKQAIEGGGNGWYLSQSEENGWPQTRLVVTEPSGDEGTCEDYE